MTLRKGIYNRKLIIGDFNKHEFMEKLNNALNNTFDLIITDNNVTKFFKYDHKNIENFVKLLNNNGKLKLYPCLSNSVLDESRIIFYVDNIHSYFSLNLERDMQIHHVFTPLIQNISEIDKKFLIKKIVSIFKYFYKKTIEMYVNHYNKDESISIKINYEIQNDDYDDKALTTDIFLKSYHKNFIIIFQKDENPEVFNYYYKNLIILHSNKKINGIYFGRYKKLYENNIYEDYGELLNFDYTTNKFIFYEEKFKTGI
jgi:hypothetical protein